MHTVVDASCSATGGVPLWLYSPDGPLFAWFHEPDNNVARASVLFCPSMAREQIAGYAACRELATQLAKAGFAVLRFDYFGTGDSAGDVSGNGAISACQRSIATAQEWLRDVCRGPMIIVGLRLGATLAAMAVRSGVQRPEGFILWDPVESGRKWLRHQVLLHRLFIGEQADETSLAGVEVTGFLYELAVAAAVESLLLGEIDNLADRLLVLGGSDEKWVDRVTSATVAAADPSHRANFLDVSTLRSTLPLTTMTLIATWCRQHFPPAGYALNQTFDAVGLLKASNGTPIRERATRFGSARVFALISEPTGEAQGPGVVLLNVGVEPHMGPSRMWVDLARQWAAKGVRSVRVDLSGLGDSDAAYGEVSAVAFPPHAMSDLSQIARAFSPEDPSNLVWVGLCAGGYHALEAAAGIGAAGAFAVNPSLTIVPPEGRLPRAKSWRRICRFIPVWARDRSPGRGSDIKSERHVMGLIYLSVRWLGLMPAPSRGLLTLNRNSGNTFVVSGPREAKPLLWLRLGKRLGLFGAIRLRIIEDLQHSLQFPRQRDEIGDMATRWLMDEVIATSNVDSSAMRHRGRNIGRFGG